MSPAKMPIEWPMPELGRWKKLDLVVELDNRDEAAVEFKFPRDAPRTYLAGHDDAR